MHITPKHLAYGGVLGLGVAALMLDSVFPPSTAAASGSPVAPATATALATAAGAYMPLDTGLAPLADRLAQLNARREVMEGAARDVFALDRQVWGVEPEQAGPVPASETDKPLVVSAIMQRPGEWVAVVNGQFVRVGDYVDGVRVESISPNKVVVERGGMSLTLDLKR